MPPQPGEDAGTGPWCQEDSGGSDPNDDIAGQADERSTIAIRGGDLPMLVQQAEQSLIASGVSLYQRAGELVRVVRMPGVTPREFAQVSNGELQICAVDRFNLVELFTKAARWEWLSPKTGDTREVNCPGYGANTYLSKAGDWLVAPLLGIIETPILRRDGSVFEQPGYDGLTGLFFDDGGRRFPPIPRNPTREDARQALKALRAVIAEFPFVSEADRSAWLAAVLTACTRPTLKTAPLFSIRAPTMASGKSLLADAVAMIATGRSAAVMPQGRDEDEDRKRMLALLRQGVRVAVIDNIERDFGSASLCSVLTLERWARPRSLRSRLRQRRGSPPATTPVWLETSPQGWSCAISTPR